MTSRRKSIRGSRRRSVRGSRRRSNRKSRTPQRKSPISTFFQKSFCISLMGSKKWPKVEKQFKRFGVKCDRFIAIDGRCKDLSFADCEAKAKSFEIGYEVKISYTKDDLRVLLPAASLTIGTIILLRAQVRNKWSSMLIFEDDVEFVKDINQRFKKGIKALNGIDWDVVYLGCGNRCGIRDIREGRDRHHPHPSMGNRHYGTNIYTKDKRDLRSICDERDCTYLSEEMTRAYTPKGTWAYGYSLKGAKKVLKLIDNNANEHIDHILAGLSADRKIKAYAFDPIIVHHEYGTGGQSSIPWDW